MSDGLLINVSAETFLARLRGAPDRLRSQMEAVIERLSIQVQSSVKQKLTGDVLHVRTGTLRRSINRVVKASDRSVVATVGTNVRYAAAHEYGFDGIVNVREHARKTKSGGVTTVRAFSRHMVLAKRSFLRSTLEDFRAQINTDIRAAAIEALR